VCVSQYGYIRYTERPDTEHKLGNSIHHANSIHIIQIQIQILSLSSFENHNNNNNNKNETFLTSSTLGKSVSPSPEVSSSCQSDMNTSATTNVNSASQSDSNTHPFSTKIDNSSSSSSSVLSTPISTDNNTTTASSSSTTTTTSTISTPTSSSIITPTQNITTNDEDDFKTPLPSTSNTSQVPRRVSTVRQRTAVKMLDMSRSPILPKPQSHQLSTIPFAGGIRCKTTENSISLKGRLFVKMNQLSSSSSSFEGEYQYRIPQSNISSSSLSSSSSKHKLESTCTSCGKIPDLGHARKCVECSMLHCKYCKGSEMKKLGAKQWIHPRCADRRSRSGACELCGDKLAPNSPSKRKGNTISRFITPRKRRVTNQVQCQLCGVRYCMPCFRKNIQKTMKRIDDTRWIHLKCEERLLKRSSSGGSAADKEWSSKPNRITGSLYPCSHTPGMVLVTMAVFLNEYVGMRVCVCVFCICLSYFILQIDTRTIPRGWSNVLWFYQVLQIVP